MESSLRRCLIKQEIFFIIFLLFTYTCLTTLSSCKQHIISGHGDIVTQPRSVVAFSNIQIDAPVNAVVNVIAGTATCVQLKGYKNILDNIETRVDNGNLTVVVKDDIVINTDEHLVLEITTPILNKLVIAGAANAELSGHVSSNAFAMDVTGAGDVTISNLNTQRLNIHMSGAGTVLINSGLVDHAQCKITGAGNLKAFNLICSNVEAVVSGAGNAELHVAKTLNAKITGVGNISYKGTPAIISSIEGVGNLKNAN